MTFRETPLSRKLKARIHRDGPLSVKEYVEACLNDPEHGYYRRRPAIGADGDFITAPEISQVFGELIGLWCAVVWQQMGAPQEFDLVEFGPGRGTLMSDVLRATRIVPGFHDALALRLVDSNTTLTRFQKAALEPHARRDTTHAWTATWHETPAACAAALAEGTTPFLVIANEFLDTCPGEQYVIKDRRPVLRGVGLDEAGALAFTLLPDRPPPPDLAPLSLSEGDCVEVQDFGFFDPFAHLMAERPSAALFIDYGATTPRAADTLQAVRGQKAEHPLLFPGEADLSFQVDFTRFASSAHAVPGLATDGPTPQAAFLGKLGIVERASRLMSANPEKAGAIEAGVQRLMAPIGMGSRFLAVGVRPESLAPLPGLE